VSEQFKEPLQARADKRDEEVRRAGLVTGGESPRPPRYRPYQPVKEKDLTGRSIAAPGLLFKPDAPRGRKVPMPNEGPAQAWPGKYPSEPRRKD